MKGNQIRVAFIIATLSMGGAEKQLVYTLNELDKRKVRPKLFIIKSSTKLLEQLSDEVEVYIGGMQNVLSFTKWVELNRAIKKFNPDIVHSNLYNANLYSRFLKLIFQKLIVINHVHGLGENYSLLRRILDRATLQYVDKVLVVSHKSKDIREIRDKIPSFKLEVLYNSVAFEKNHQECFGIQHRSTQPFILGTASRLIKLKNIEAAIYLTKRLSEKNLNVNLKIAGEGPEMEHLKAYVKRLGMESKVTFLGFVKNMKEYYNSLNFFVICSTTEDLPLSIVEALSVGRPIIATDVGGIPEMLKDTIHIIGSNFFEDHFIDKSSSFILNCSFEKAYQVNREIAVERFDRKKNTDRLVEIYNQLLR